MSNSSRISSLTDSFYSKLSMRERIILVVFVLSLCGTAFYFVFDHWSEKQSSTQEMIIKLREGIAEVKAGESRFRDVLAHKKAYEQLLKDNKLDLSKLMERYAKESELTIEGIKGQRRVLSDQLDSKAKNAEVVVAYTQEVSLGPTSLDLLSQFLEKLESERSPVRVTSLSFRTFTQDRQELRTIKLNVTTYKSEIDK
jgi:hypothetical protein